MPTPPDTPLEERAARAVLENAELRADLDAAYAELEHVTRSYLLLAGFAAILLALAVAGWIA